MCKIHHYSCTFWMLSPAQKRWFSEVRGLAWVLKVNSQRGEEIQLKSPHCIIFDNYVPARINRKNKQSLNTAIHTIYSVKNMSDFLTKNHLQGSQPSSDQSQTGFYAWTWGYSNIYWCISEIFTCAGHIMQ